MATHKQLQTVRKDLFSGPDVATGSRAIGSAVPPFLPNDVTAIPALDRRSCQSYGRRVLVLRADDKDDKDDKAATHSFPRVVWVPQPRLSFEQGNRMRLCRTRRTTAAFSVGSWLLASRQRGRSLEFC